VRRKLLLRLLAGLAAGFACALLVSCGSSTKGLIPEANAGPLKSDFEAVAEAAETGNGNCKATEVAIATTERDFANLPSDINAGLRNTLQVGIRNLSKHARELCLEPTGGATTTTGKTTTTTTTATTTTGTTTTATVPTVTVPTVTVPTTSTPSTTTTPPVGGGTAPEGEAPGSGGAGEATGGVNNGAGSGGTANGLGASGGQEAGR
jgi:hypothetical protein